MHRLKKHTAKKITERGVQRNWVLRFKSRSKIDIALHPVNSNRLVHQFLSNKTGKDGLWF